MGHALRIDVISLFPDFIAQCAAFGVTGRAGERGLLSLHGWNPRDYAEGNYRRVDERPFGGGPGMVMLIDPLLIRRPLMDVEGELRVGFDAEAVNGWIGLNNAKPEGDIETCPKGHHASPCPTPEDHSHA